MIDLGHHCEPYDLALPYGLSVTVKPLTTAGMAAAQAVARRATEAIERQTRQRTEAGLPLDGLPDLSAEGERDGFYQAQLIRELAVRHITSWTGVELGSGPAPPTPKNIAAVMELYPVGERFFQEFTLRQVLLTAAKNACGPLPALCPRRTRSLRAALPLPRAGLDQPAGARSLGRAARLPKPAAPRAERGGDRHRDRCSAHRRRRLGLRPRGALRAAAVGRSGSRRRVVPARVSLT